MSSEYDGPDNVPPPQLTASQWRQIVNSATDTAIIGTDPAGRVMSWNTGAERIFGWAEAEMIGRPLERLFTPQDRSKGLLAQEISDAIEFGRGGGDEGWRVRKDGSQVWAAGEVTPIRDDTGSIVGFVKIVRDRTNQRRAEDEIAQERQALAILNRAGSALAQESELQKLVQVVTDAGVRIDGRGVRRLFLHRKRQW